MCDEKGYVGDYMKCVNLELESDMCEEKGTLVTICYV